MREAVSGVAFLLFPQADGSYAEPERVVLEPLGGPIGVGPADDRMRVIDAIGKTPYDPPSYLPPWRGPVAAPARPGPRGHFDHLAVGTRQFAQAHLFGCMRLTLNVWERFLGHRIHWSGAEVFPVLELIPLVAWPNAQSGPGFLETGAVRNAEGDERAYCLNLDVIAHEVGHTVLFAELGTPLPGRLTAQFLAFHECFADLTTIIAALQFDSVADRVLAETGGNLYAENEINRIAELSSTEQIRRADTMAKMADVATITLAEDGTWRDGTGRGRNAHALAEPLTGALFDFFVNLFQERLVADGIVPPDEDPRGWTRAEIAARLGQLERVHRACLRRSAAAFRTALLHARDGLALTLARTIAHLGPDDLSFDGVAGAMRDVVLALFGEPVALSLDDIFAWRGITPRRAASARPPERRRYTPMQPFAAQMRAAHAACCSPSPRSRPLAHALELGRLVRQEHREPRV
jgi:hypothetical protein